MAGDLEEEEDNELGVLLKAELNTLAALFYQSDGRMFFAELDFSSSQHGEEVGCWNKACIAYSVINSDSWFLQFQV